MADISPNSVIKVLSNVPLDPTYEHTIYFASKTDQLNYFDPLTNSKVKYSFQNNTYQRVNSGVLRIARCADDLYDCNYLMFQNTAFGNKWFYCFIKSVEYVNNAVSEITYEIDVMQTWMFDYSLEMCFVEREHSVTDEIGDNTVPENLEIGDYMYESLAKMWSNIDAWSIIVAAGFKAAKTVVPEEGEQWVIIGDAVPGFYNRYYTGIEFNAIPAISTDIESFNSIIHTIFAEKRIEEIVGIYMMPTNVVSTKSSSMQQSPTEISKTIAKQTSWNYGSNVKNKKLYTYPYNMLYVASSDGNNASYKYEYFSSAQCVFSCECAMGLPPECSLIPKDYSFTGTTTDLKNYNFALSLKNFPMCSWMNDAFMAWLAQSTTSVLGAIGLGATAAAIAPETIETVGENVGSTIAKSVSGFGKALLMPNHVHGVNKNTLSIGDNEFGYHFYNARIKNEYAEIIDDYFNRFGYATKITKVPNISSRPHWNYVKTIACTITGSVPADTARKICSIFDNGITFWKHGSEVGNYSLDNRPVTTPVEEVAYG